MSVRVGERRDGKIKLFNTLRILINHTLVLTANRKTFPLERMALTNRIVGEALDVEGCIKRSSSHPIENSADYQYCLQQLKESYAHLECLLKYMENAYDDKVIKIDGKRIEYWTGLVIDVETDLEVYTKEFVKNHKPFLNDQFNNQNDKISYLSTNVKGNDYSGSELVVAYS